MTVTGMTPARVLELIAAFGGDPEGWPQAERQAAQALIEAQPDTFEAALQDARQLDTLLSSESPIVPSDDLFERILATAPLTITRQYGWLAGLRNIVLPQGVRWPAGAALASLAVGVVGGYAYASTGNVSSFDQIDQAYSSAVDFEATSSWLLEEGA